MIDHRVKLCARLLIRPKIILVLLSRTRDRGQREIYECIVKPYVMIAEELEKLPL